jgi:ABC-2 type transport system ATP-binding protein
VGRAARERAQGVGVIRLRGVNFSYDVKNPILQEVDLDFPPGLTLLLGPNGSGKTTLLRVAAGVERPDAGHVEVEGIDLWKDEARARRPLAYVPEHPDLTPYASVGEIMRLVCRLRGEPVARAMEALAEAGLRDHASHTVRELSTGQKRRALLAAARIGTPRVVLLDEPLEGLDREMRDRVLEWVESRRLAGAAIALVTHQLEPFVATASRAVGLQGGRPVVIDPLPENEEARKAALERLARGQAHALDARVLRPGLWRWTAPHPEWVPGKDKPGGWGRMVGCVSYEPADPREPFVLFDPLAPPAGTPEEAAFWKALDADVARRPAGVAVVLGNWWHERSAGVIRSRYAVSPGCVVWAPPGARGRVTTPVDREVAAGAQLPGGVRAIPIEGLGTAEAIYYIPDHRAIVTSDAIIGAGQGRLRVPPHWWAEDTPEAQRLYRESFRAELARLLELPIDMVLVSHGDPAERDGADALREALAAPAWGE